MIHLLTNPSEQNHPESSAKSNDEDNDRGMHIGGGGGGGDGTHLHRHHDTNQSKVRFTQTNSFVGLLDDGDEAEGGGGSSEQKRDVRGADGEIDTTYSSHHT